MPRWEPGTRERLERAALELFTARGYDDVTVTEIAERAGVAKATFFRLFADKREVLFYGQDALVELLVDGLAATPSTSTADRLASALESSAAAFPAERHELAAARDSVIAAHADLRERLAAKRAAMRDALFGAFTRLGTPTPDAVLGAEIGRVAFSAAYRRWAAAPVAQDFADLADEELAVLLSAAVRLAPGASPAAPARAPDGSTSAPAAPR